MVVDNHALAGPGSDGKTPLPAELQADLLPTWVATIGELYEVEELGIAAATLGLAPALDELLDDVWLKRLHARMLRDVWRWAGRYRKHDTNIGWHWPEVPVGIRDLLADARTWAQVGTFGPVEAAVRLHHRFEVIHPFPNGNGRFGRIIAGYYCRALGGPELTWGAGLGLDTAGLRAVYLGALRTMDADGDDVDDLVAFATS